MLRHFICVSWILLGLFCQENSFVLFFSIFGVEGRADLRRSLSDNRSSDSWYSLRSLAPFQACRRRTADEEIESEFICRLTGLLLQSPLPHWSMIHLNTHRQGSFLLYPSQLGVQWTHLSGTLLGEFCTLFWIWGVTTFRVLIYLGLYFIVLGSSFLVCCCGHGGLLLSLPMEDSLVLNSSVLERGFQGRSKAQNIQNPFPVTANGKPAR